MTNPAPTLAELEAEEARLYLPSFDETMACHLGTAMLTLKGGITMIN